MIVVLWPLNLLYSLFSLRYDRFSHPQWNICRDSWTPQFLLLDGCISFEKKSFLCPKTSIKTNQFWRLKDHFIFYATCFCIIKSFSSFVRIFFVIEINIFGGLFSMVITQAVYIYKIKNLLRISENNFQIRVDFIKFVLFFTKLSFFFILLFSTYFDDNVQRVCMFMCSFFFFIDLNLWNLLFLSSSK